VHPASFSLALAPVARALVRFVQVRDGRVTGVRTGGYGYSE